MSEDYMSFIVDYGNLLISSTQMTNDSFSRGFVPTASIVYRFRDHTSLVNHYEEQLTLQQKKYDQLKLDSDNIIWNLEAHIRQGEFKIKATAEELVYLKDDIRRLKIQHESELAQVYYTLYCTLRESASHISRLYIQIEDSKAQMHKLVTFNRYSFVPRNLFDLQKAEFARVEGQYHKSVQRLADLEEYLSQNEKSLFEAHCRLKYLTSMSEGMNNYLKLMRDANDSLKYELSRQVYYNHASPTKAYLQEALDHTIEHANSLEKRLSNQQIYCDMLNERNKYLYVPKDDSSMEYFQDYTNYIEKPAKRALSIVSVAYLDGPIQKPGYSVIYKNQIGCSGCTLLEDKFNKFYETYKKLLDSYGSLSNNSAEYLLQQQLKFEKLRKHDYSRLANGFTEHESELLKYLEATKSELTAEKNHVVSLTKKVEGLYRQLLQTPLSGAVITVPSAYGLFMRGQVDSLRHYHLYELYRQSQLELNKERNKRQETNRLLESLKTMLSQEGNLKLTYLEAIRIKNQNYK